MRQPNDAWFRRLGGDPRAPKVFAFGPAGASSASFNGWRDGAAEAAEAVEVVAIRLPGREARQLEAPFTEIEPLADALAAAIIRFTEQPCVLFGHSLGGLIAREVMMRLERRRVAALITAAAHPPHSLSAPNVPDLSNGALLRILLRLGGTPPEVLADPEAQAHYLPILRADFLLGQSCARAITSSGLCDVPIVALAGTEDAHAPASVCEGWAEWTRATFELMHMPGGHFFPRDAGRPIVRLATELLTTHTT